MRPSLALSTLFLCAGLPGCGTDAPSGDSSKPETGGSGGANAGTGGSVSGDAGSGVGGSAAGAGGTGVAGTGTAAASGAGGRGGSGPPSDCLPVPTGVPLARDLGYQPDGPGGGVDPFDAKIDRQGRVVVVGGPGSSRSQAVNAVRFDVNGVTDRASGGFEMSYEVRDDVSYLPTTVAFDAADRIWIGSTASTPNAAGDSHDSPLIVRALEDGSLDESFNAAETPGYRLFRPPRETVEASMYSANMWGIYPLREGALVHGSPTFMERMREDGSFDLAARTNVFLWNRTFYDGTLYATTDVSINAFDLDLNPLTAFGEGGVLAIDMLPDFRAFSTLPLPDGRFLLIAYTDGLKVYRLLPTGRIDTTFGLEGLLNLGPVCDLQEVRVACDGRIFMVGTRLTPMPPLCAVELSPDGSLPANAPVGGVTAWSASETENASAEWIMFDPAGRIVAVNGSSAGIYLLRFAPPWATP